MGNCGPSNTGTYESPRVAVRELRSGDRPVGVQRHLCAITGLSATRDSARKRNRTDHARGRLRLLEASPCCGHLGQTATVACGSHPPRRRVSAMRARSGLHCGRPAVRTPVEPWEQRTGHDPSASHSRGGLSPGRAWPGEADPGRGQARPTLGLAGRWLFQRPAPEPVRRRGREWLVAVTDSCPVRD